MNSTTKKPTDVAAPAIVGRFDSVLSSVLAHAEVIFVASVAFAALLWFMSSRSTAAAQKPAPPAPQYQPTHEEMLQLEVDQRDVELSYVLWRQAQQDLDAKRVALATDAERIKAAHHWPPGVQFDAEHLTFATPPPAAPKLPIGPR